MHNGSGESGLLYSTNNPLISWLTSKEWRGYLFVPKTEYLEELNFSFERSIPLHTGAFYAKHIAFELYEAYAGAKNSQTWLKKCNKTWAVLNSLQTQMQHRVEGIHKQMYNQVAKITGMHVSSPESYMPTESSRQIEDSEYFVALSEEASKVREMGESPPSNKNIGGESILGNELCYEIERLKVFGV